MHKTFVRVFILGLTSFKNDKNPLFMAMLAEKIRKFENSLSEVAAAIQLDDENIIRDRDKSLRVAWKELVELEPDTHKERVALATFLLGQIKGTFDDARIVEQIRDRVIYLISSL